MTTSLPEARTAYVVALSGGADSTALLWACAQVRPQGLHAIHIHHGLQDAADAFESHARVLCERLGVPLQVCRVQARHASGQSPEDAARVARYAALADAARGQGAHCVLLAQHGDDQVETVILALSRGAGVAGLAAMPARFDRHGMGFVRPWLGQGAADIRAWLASQGVSHIEDPSNADLRFTRNRIRRQILPTMEAAFPALRTVVARSARHAAQASELLDDLARIDLEAVGHPPAIAALQTLSAARQANVLRHWLLTAHGATPTTAQLDELLRQVSACTTRGHAIQLRVGRGQVQRVRAHLVYSPSRSREG